MLDCGFAAAADVFDECYAAARLNITGDELPDFLDPARVIGKLGRGAEPLLAFLEHWPDVVEVTGLAQSATLPPAMAAIRSLQKSPNGPAVTPLLQTLGAVAERLRTAEALQHYLTLALDLATRTSGLIHGHHVTEPSPALPDFLLQAPRLLGVVSLAGLKRWLDDGIRLYGDHPDNRRAYFALASPDSRAILQREREGTLFADVERRLNLTLAALWQDDSLLVPYSTAFTDVRLHPYLAADGMRLPDALEDKDGISGLDRYRAMLATWPAIAAGACRCSPTTGARCSAWPSRRWKTPASTPFCCAAFPA